VWRHPLPAVGALGVALDEGPLSHLHGDEDTLPARDHLRVRTCERINDTLPARDHLRVVCVCVCVCVCLCVCVFVCVCVCVCVCVRVT
jgi:hypothetical protein